MPKVLIAGASGLVGNAAVRHFAAMPGWEVVGLSRRIPAPIPGARLISLDLTDEAACATALRAIPGVTHLVYAALQELPGLFAGWQDEALIAQNGAMLRNLFEPLIAASPGLEHVSLLHGTKAYGVHHPSVGWSASRFPLREREPRIDHPNFYFVQEDYLRERQAHASWGLTVFRPTVIYGDAPGNNMNAIPALGAYAALLRERGEPLHFPGQDTLPGLHEALDARIMAAALGWAATSPAARGGTFNLTNGDVFTWQNVWPAIARALGMEPGEHRPLLLADELPAHQDDWAAIVRKYGLVAPASIVEFAGLNSLTYTDMVLRSGRPGVPLLNSTIAARKAGFGDCIDTEDMFVELFNGLQEQRLLPPR